MQIKNIPHKLFYSAMSAEMLWTSKTSTKFLDFIKYAKILIRRITMQGDLIKHMKKALLKLFNSHKECFLNSKN